MQFDIRSEHIITIYANDNNKKLTDDLQIIFSSLFDKDKYEDCPIPSSSATKHIENIDSTYIGQIIKVLYYPYSQKYIDYYEEQHVMGKIFFVDELTKDALMYYDEFQDGKLVRIIKSISRDHCSYYGDSRGYDYAIYLI